MNITKTFSNCTAWLFPVCSHAVSITEPLPRNKMPNHDTHGSPNFRLRRLEASARRATITQRADRMTVAAPPDEAPVRNRRILPNIHNDNSGHFEIPAARLISESSAENITAAASPELMPIMDEGNYVSPETLAKGAKCHKVIEQISTLPCIHRIPYIDYLFDSMVPELQKEAIPSVCNLLISLSGDERDRILERVRVVMEAANNR